MAKEKEKIRKSGKDLKAEYEDLITKAKALENKITKRLLDLCVTYPEAVVEVYKEYSDDNHITEIKAKTYNESYIKNYLTTNDRVEAIINIEKWLADQHPHKQLELEYPEDRVCNCDGRDMPVYEEDGKKWCPQCGYEVK